MDSDSTAVAVNFVVDLLASMLIEFFSSESEQAIKGLRGSKIDIRDEMEKLGKELRSMHSFLREAEHSTASGALADWAEQVQETSRKVEDMLELMVYCGRGQAWDESWSSIAQKYMATHLAKIKNEFESDIPKRRERYQCKNMAPREDDAKRRDQWQFPQSHNVKDELIGVEQNEDILTGWLLHEANVDTPRNIAISICGMGGLGKTALAMKVYGESKIKECFDCSAWVSMSRSCSVDQLMGSIIRQVTDDAIGPDNLHSSSSSREDLLTSLQNSLRGKRYMIVLDGVSSRNACDELSHFLLQNGAPGSRVLLTTRDRRIASSLSTEERHVLNLQLLSEEEAWSLFCNKAFRSNHCPKELEDWARKIVAKCGGLPLAIVTLASVMSTKDRKTLTWKQFYDSMGAEFRDNEKLVDMSRDLMLDFHGLPSNLKLCYLYCCGIFPVSYVIKKNCLIRLWVAEGFVEERQGITKEDVAEDYLDKLVRANLVQVAIADEMGRTKACRVHALMREISLAATRVKPFTVLDERETRVDDATRRLSIQKSIKGSPVSLPKGKKKNKAATVGDNVISSLRSLLVFSGDKVSAASFVAMSPNFMLLKVLELRDLPIAHVPDEVADLFNLKYLSLRRTDVKDLPKHIDKLQMLETLDVKGTRVAYIPRRIRKLTRLRHLLMDQPRLHTTDDILITLTTKLHSWVWQLKELLSLKTVQVDVLIIEDMAELVHLRRLGLANLEEKQGFNLCNSLSEMRELLSLSIKAAPDDALMLESLTSPPPHLQKLVVDGRMQKLPMWFGVLSSLTHLYLMDSQLGDDESDPLPLLGKLEKLLHLTLRRAYNGSRLCFAARQFRHLKSLNIEALQCLSELEVEEDGLPSLCVLHLCRCGHLERIEGIDELPSVCLIYLQEMPYALASVLGEDSRVKKSNGWKSVCNSTAWPA